MFSLFPRKKQLDADEKQVSPPADPAKESPRVLQPAEASSEAPRNAPPRPLPMTPRVVPLPEKRITQKPPEEPLSTVPEPEASPAEPWKPVALHSSIFKVHSTPSVIPELLEGSLDEAHLELGVLRDETPVEFTQEYLRSDTRDESVETLFNLAYEVVAHPELESKLVEEFTTSEKRHVESKTLATQLAQVERRISLPVFGLRSLKERRAAEREEAVRELEPATIGDRLSAFAIDVLCTILAGFAIVVVLAAIVDPKFFERIENILDASTADLLTFGSLVLAATALLSILYPLFCLLIANRTFGQKLCKIRVVTELGRTARVSHVMVRSLSFPLSLLLFGYAPLLRGRRPLHDLLARTKLCREAADIVHS